MSVFTHAFNHRPRHQRGLFRQVALLISGRGVVVPRSEVRDDCDTTEYLLSTAANRAQIEQGLAEFARGEAREHALR